MKEREIDKKLICDCCGEKGVYQLGAINVCPACVDYALESAQVICVRLT